MNESLLGLQPCTSTGDDELPTTPKNKTSPRLQLFKKKDLRSQTKNVIVNVVNFVNKLSDPSFLESVDFKKTQDVASKMCGVSLRSIQRCMFQRRALSGKSFDSPRKKYIREKKRSLLSDFDCDVTRRIVLSFYDRGEFPTAEKIRVELHEKIGYAGSTRSVQRLLKNLGFKYRKVNDGRKFLMERSDIAQVRACFLRKIHALKKEKYPRQRIYLDETWVNQNHTKQQIWHQETNLVSENETRAELLEKVKLIKKEKSMNSTKWH